MNTSVPAVITGNKFGVPLFLLISWLVAEPFLPKALAGYWVYGYFLIFLTALFFLNKHKRIFLVYMLAVAAISFLGFFNLKSDLIITRKINIILEILFSVSVTVNIVWYTSDFKNNIKDGISGAILGFLIMAGCFAIIYYGVCSFDPAVVHFSTISKGIIQQKEAASLLEAGDLIYLSFITITTCGYGDILPVSALAKRLCSIEACTGALYLAIFVGRLFAMHHDKIKTDKEKA